MYAIRCTESLTHPRIAGRYFGGSESEQLSFHSNPLCSRYYKTDEEASEMARKLKSQWYGNFCVVEMHVVKEHKA